MVVDLAAKLVGLLHGGRDKEHEGLGPKVDAMDRLGGGRGALALLTGDVDDRSLAVATEKLLLPGIRVELQPVSAKSDRIRGMEDAL